MNSNVIVLPYMRVLKTDTKIRIERVLSKNKECVFQFGSKLLFRVYITNSYNESKRCYLRVVIHANNGDPVAMSHTENPLFLDTGSNEKNLLLDIAQIVPGDYYLDMILIDYGKYGAEMRMDALQAVYRFRIVECEGFNLNKNWYKAGWGYINNGVIFEESWQK